MSADRQDHLPPEGALLATTFVAADQVSPLARAIGAGALIPLAFSRFRAVEGMLGWGDRPSARRARAAAQRRSLPYWSVEDGFLRSVGLGKAGMPGISYVVDDLGVYFDARRPSRLEEIIRATKVTADQEQRVTALLKLVCDNRLSKYNDPVSVPSGLGPRSRRRILLVDQTAGDRSIEGACASPETFRTMIEAARREHLDAELVFRPHPDQSAGLAGSAAEAAGHTSLVTVAAGTSPAGLLAEVDEVWTVSSLTGFEALLRGIPVTTFGAPFYAGWGLTADRANGAEAEAALARRRSAPKTLADVAHAALIAYPVYLDPATGRRTTPEEACEQLLLWREQARKLGRNHVCVGFSRWKQPHARAYLATGGGSQRFVDEARARREVKAGDHVVVWGMKSDDAFADEMRQRGARFSRIEDGFIRSFGLGSNFLFPWSLCIDDSGIYFDATRPSDLETLIASAPVPADRVKRVRILRERIVALGLTKYNLSGAPPPDLREKAGAKPLLLALGQVPDDHSIRLGCILPKSNLDFLARVRAENPDAFLIYKEHPDVVSGNRPGRSDPTELSRLADLVLQEGDTAQWISACDHIHVMTSLAGFEALLRGKPVTCWGMPFYAGWGLTIDKVESDRRGVSRSLDEVVARALIDYNLFRIDGVGVPLSPESLLTFVSQRQRLADHLGTRDVLAGQSYRLLKYVVAQMAATLRGGAPAQLHSVARPRWPFFRRVP